MDPSHVPAAAVVVVAACLGWAWVDARLTERRLERARVQAAGCPCGEPGRVYRQRRAGKIVGYYARCAGHVCEAVEEPWAAG